MQPYPLTVIQPAVKPVFKGGSAFRRDALDENLERACHYIRVAGRTFGSKVVVLPEFFLHGFEPGHGIDEWIGASLRIPGPEVEALGAAAREANCYVAGMVYEVMDEFPGRFWNTAIIIDPDGQVALKYHKLYAMTGKTRPGDVYTDYVERMGGPGALFPVLDTPYGRLGCLICYDINFPEVTRCLAMRGAEVFLHIASETRSPYHLPEGGWTLAKRVRAYENMAFLASANQGPVIDGEFPADRHHGESQILDFNGQVLNMARTSGETMVTAMVDIDALRRRRQQPGMNFLAELMPAIHAPIYAQEHMFPIDHWQARPIDNIAENRALARQVIEARTKAGRLVPPGPE
jgi:predicted amidohydrolase